MNTRANTFLYLVVLICCAVTNGDTLSAKTSDKILYIPLDTLSCYFRLPEEKGWRELSNGFHPFDTTRLYDLIDGGAVLYIQHGLLHGIYHRMQQEDGRRYDALVMEFVTPEKASAMYREQKKLTGSDLQVGTFDTTEVCASDVLSGICIYGYFASVYFELTLTGYKDLSMAKKEAVRFVGIFKKQSSAIGSKSKKEM